MADYKILDQSVKGDWVNVVYFVPIEDADLRPKLVDVAMPGINIDGTIYEHIEKIKFSANLTNGQKLAIIADNQDFINLSATINNRLGKKYQFYGTEGDII